MASALSEVGPEVQSRRIKVSNENLLNELKFEYPKGLAIFDADDNSYWFVYDVDSLSDYVKSDERAHDNKERIIEWLRHYRWEPLVPDLDSGSELDLDWELNSDNTF
ncbi:uncharacterized protein KQ657_003901 [Scheffersomyces spartinae]|uniref:Uncharacterized protein n=1 Tax=Scheffersomyces spartinae TaxID=45513 RepID=A0A9P7VCJ2_9ASCO|nr:uncharacterized protein KQ657_003901 [Scheffersomyces spartinae]KAG7195372.1 hypothetical protein KQ657_003901 [Scheffersomyces spartinae]